MTRAPTPIRYGTPPRPRSRAALVALVLLGMVQLFVAAVVPFVEARASSGLGMHVEQPNDTHYVHDDANCAACIARGITGPAPGGPVVLPLVVRTVARESSTLVAPPDAERLGPPAARAPPPLPTLG